MAETPDATTATVHLPDGIAAAHDVDLLGRVGGSIDPETDGSLRIPLRAWEIRTFRIAPGRRCPAERQAPQTRDVDVTLTSPRSHD